MPPPASIPERLATAVYQRELASTGIRRRSWSALRSLLSRALGDPACRLPIHGRLLRLPLSHPLPAYLNLLPFYDRLPGRLAAFLRENRASLHGIDVGANIGDSLAAFGLLPDDRFLAIEPSPVFHASLRENFGETAGVTLLEAVCGDQSDASSGTWRIHTAAGTAAMHPSEEGIRLPQTTLDTCIQDTPWETETSLLKIDTDGHDFAVLRGARRLLASRQPAVLFECAPHGNPAFLEEALDALQLLAGSGYESVLLYNNLGHFLGIEPLSDRAPMKARLQNQLADGGYYLDLLTMPRPQLAEFHSRERSIFGNNTTTGFPDTSQGGSPPSPPAGRGGE